MPRLARPLLNCVIGVGLAIAALPVGQTVYGLWNQRSLAAQWQSSLKAKPSVSVPATKRAGIINVAKNDLDSPALVNSAKPGQKHAPWPLTKLTIPAIDLETYAVQGMDAAALRRGPGHDPNSSLPGQGNCVIAGHRNIYGSFFYRLDELLPGTPITLENRDGKFTYIVDAVAVTADTNLTILNSPPQGAPPVLTLITCTLPHSSNRIVLQANLSQE